jgi:hypothetical protein
MGRLSIKSTPIGLTLCIRKPTSGCVGDFETKNKLTHISYMKKKMSLCCEDQQLEAAFLLLLKFHIVLDVFMNAGMSLQESALGFY